MGLGLVECLSVPILWQYLPAYIMRSHVCCDCVRAHSGVGSWGEYFEYSTEVVGEMPAPGNHQISC